MVPLDDEHWTSEETPEQNFLYPQTWTTAWIVPVPMSLHANYNNISHMDSLDLSDISDYEDYMVTSIDEVLY